MGMADVYKNEKNRWEECKACAAEPLIIAASIGCLLLLRLASAAAAAALALPCDFKKKKERGWGSWAVDCWNWVRYCILKNWTMMLRGGKRKKVQIQQMTLRI